MSQQVQDRIDWRERFLAERRTGIGGSDIAAIVGRLADAVQAALVSVR